MEISNNSPRFFFSYAREDNETYLERFFNDLSDEVALRGGFSKDSEEAGFRDTKDLQSGDDFDEALTSALRTSQSLVCIYTTRYFTREYCGKEFHAFLTRQGITTKDGKVRSAKCILPVLWLSETDLSRKGLPPEVLSRIQYISNVNAEEQRQKGLRAILQRGRRGKYREILKSYVDRILEWTEGDSKFLPEIDFGDIAALPNAFDASNRSHDRGKNLSGPKNLLLIVLTDTTREKLLPIEKLIDDDALIENHDIQKFNTTDAISAIKVLSNAKNSNVLPILFMDLSLSDKNTSDGFFWKVLSDKSWHGGVYITVSSDKMDAYLALNDKLRSNVEISQRLIIRENVVEGTAEDRFNELVLTLQQKIMKDHPVLRSSPSTATMTKPILNIRPNK